MVGAILLYHRVGLREPDASGLCVGFAEFRAHMRHLGQQYRLVPLDALSDTVRSSHSRPAVAVTFDDGYFEHLTVISPVLLEFRIPATFFLNTIGLHTGIENWWDTLERVFLMDHELPPVLDLRGMGQLDVWPSTRHEAYRQLHRAIYPLPADERQRLVDELMTWSGLDFTPRPSHRVLTQAEVVQLASHETHAIGAHTVNHLALTYHAKAIVQEEIIQGKRVLEGILSRPIAPFAYPYGEHDENVVNAVHDAGFRTAVTVQPGLVTAGADCLCLPRLEVTHCSGAQFERALAAAFEAAGSGRRVLPLQDYTPDG